MPSDLTALHLLAILLLFGAWFSYGLVLRLAFKGTLNSRLVVVREHWMMMSPHRQNRMFDALLIGHISHALAFFGSATLLVLAGVVGLLVQLHAIHETLSPMAFIETVSFELFAVKVFVVAALVLISFFLFIYALRKLNYTIALLGALPEQEDSNTQNKQMAKMTAIVLSEAIRSFNGGIRGYYFAVSSLLFFVSPMACIITTLAMFAMLLFRQTATRTAKAIDTYVETMNPEVVEPGSRERSGSELEQG